MPENQPTRNENAATPATPAQPSRGGDIPTAPAQPAKPAKKWVTEVTEEEQKKNYPRTGFETSNSTGKNEKHPDDWDVNKNPEQPNNEGATQPVQPQ